MVLAPDATLQIAQDELAATPGVGVMAQSLDDLGKGAVAFAHPATVRIKLAETINPGLDQDAALLPLGCLAPPDRGNIDVYLPRPCINLCQKTLYNLGGQN